MAFTFEKLIVYQKSVDFADAICSTTESFPRGQPEKVRRIVSFFLRRFPPVRS